MVACRREEAKLSQQVEQQRPLLRELEQRQAALIAERNAARRNHGPLLERHRLRAERLGKLQTAQTEQQHRLAESASDWNRCGLNSKTSTLLNKTAAGMVMRRPGSSFNRISKRQTQPWNKPGSGGMSC